MRLCILRSGSSGNCTLLEHDGCRILIDAGGMSQKRFGEVLGEVELTPADIHAVVVTHLHSDHINYSSLCVCRKNNIPVWIHRSNIAALRPKFKPALISALSICEFGEDAFGVGGVTLAPFMVSHDAPECTSGFRLAPESQPDNYVTYAADLGYFPDTLIDHFAGAQCVVLESNHDPVLLWNNPFRPQHHKQRVAGNRGHLSNQQTGEALINIFQASPVPASNVILCHLSNDHNSPAMALDSVGLVLDKAGFSPAITVAQRQTKTPFFEIC